MRSFAIAVLFAVALAIAFALSLNSIQKTAEMAFKSEGVRLNVVATASKQGMNGMSDSLSNALWSGAFVILGAIIAAAAGYWGALRAAQAQVQALKDQAEEERRRFQQTRHQKKYAMALALRLEAERLGVAADKRLSSAQKAVTSAGRNPRREQMTISVLPLIRGEREDIGLLNDEIQDSALSLTGEVDEYNAHIETIPRSTSTDTVIVVDEIALQQLKGLKDKATAVAAELDEFIRKVRAWRCQRCKSFIDDIFDVIEDGQRKRCPICNDTTRMQGISGILSASATFTATAPIVSIN